ncbi:MAG TPA: universal stress protein [Flavisolibacter sp.]|nr:universal stress protein [Flavisolibacter sp.]
MSQIVVPTDFSKEAEHALDYACILAKEISASLHLLHVYQIPITMVDMPVLVVSADELKKNADENLQQVKTQLQTKHPDLSIEYESRLGDVVDEITSCCEAIHPFAIVVATKKYSGLEKLLFGNTVISIIKNTSCPVISVPANATISAPKNPILASDLRVDETPVEQIIRIIQLLHAKLHVVHIKEETTDVSASEERLLQSLSEVHPVFHTVTDDDVLHGLQEYVRINHADLLFVLPHKHSLYERLFFKLHTEGLIEKMPIPVMCLPIKHK